MPHIFRFTTNALRTPTWTAVIAILALSGCGAGGNETVLTEVTGVAPGTECSAGGVRITTGVDANDDAQLDPTEVNDTALICSGVDGDGSLTSLAPEPAGANCEAGGLRVEVGVDIDGDGALDAAEATQTRYICNGVSAVPAIAPSLVDIVALTAGAECANGGVRINAGPDTDGSGVLDATEVTSSATLCNAVVSGGTPPMLVAVVAETSSPTCAAGGQTIYTGTDDNGNGSLDATEYATTAHVCNGTKGVDGTDGLLSLVNIVDEPPGSNCAAGGSRIDSGIDSDSSGTLDATEVTAASYVCGAVATGGGTGDALIATAIELPGSNCSEGGFRIDSGIDDSGDGVLQAVEVDGTAYLCNSTIADTSLCDVVGADPVSLELVPSTITLPLWEYETARLYGIYASGCRLDLTDFAYWRTLDSSIATVTNGPTTHGVVEARDVLGSVDILASYGSTTLVVPVTTVDKVLTEIDLLPSVLAMTPGTSKDALALGIYNNAVTADIGTLVSWYTTDPGVATVSAGSVSALSLGTSVITVAIDNIGDTALVYVHTPLAQTGAASGSWILDTAGALHRFGDGIGYAPGEMGPALPPFTLGLGRTAADLSVMTDNSLGSWTSRLDQETVCFLTTAREVVCRGDNSYGQLGQGNTTPVFDDDLSALPSVDLGTGRTATQVSVGGEHACALRDDASIVCWGWGGGGQLGTEETWAHGSIPGTMGDNLIRVNLGTGRTAVQIALGNDHSCALLDDASVKCWGKNTYGQLGVGLSSGTSVGYAAGQMGDALPPVDLGTGRTAVSVASGANHVCALLDDATIKCWGNNSHGQLGQGNTTNYGAAGEGAMGDALPAIALGTGRTAVAVFAGYDTTCAILDDNTLKCWGYNAYGQLGLGNTVDRGVSPSQMGDSLLPIDLGSGVVPATVAIGRHVCSIFTDGTMKCWGENIVGSLGLGDTESRGDHPNEMGEYLSYVQP